MDLIHAIRANTFANPVCTFSVFAKLLVLIVEFPFPYIFCIPSTANNSFRLYTNFVAANGPIHLNDMTGIIHIYFTKKKCTMLMDLLAIQCFMWIINTMRVSFFY